MISVPNRRVLVPVLLGSLLLMTACQPKAPSRYDDVQRETTQKGSTAVSKNATTGGSFNRFFPRPGNGYSVVPAQEKKGFAEYKLNQRGKTLAMLSISDTISTPSAAEKYKQSSFQIAGYPAIDQGKTITGVLVNSRYQVKAQTRDPSFTRENRIDWLQKFDLNGLSRVK
jgi:hypothetical protein